MELADMGHTLEQTKATAHAKLDEKVTDMCNTLDEAKAMSKEQRQKVKNEMRLGMSQMQDAFDTEHEDRRKATEAKREAELLEMQAESAQKEAEWKAQLARNEEERAKELADTKAELARLQAAHEEQNAKLEADLQENLDSQLAAAEKAFAAAEEAALQGSITTDASNAMQDLATGEEALKAQLQKERERKKEEIARRHAERKKARQAALEQSQRDEVEGLEQLQVKLEDGKALVEACKAAAEEAEVQLEQEQTEAISAVDAQFDANEQAQREDVEAKKAALDAVAAEEHLSHEEANKIIDGFEAQAGKELERLNNLREKEKAAVKRRMLERKLKRKQNMAVTNSLKSEHQKGEENRLKDTVAKRGSGLSMLAAAAFSKKGNDVKMSKREDEIRQEAEAEAFKKATAAAAAEMQAMRARVEMLESQLGGQENGSAEETEAAQRKIADDMVGNLNTDMKRLEEQQTAAKQKQREALLRRKTAKSKKVFEKKMRAIANTMEAEEKDMAMAAAAAIKPKGLSELEAFNEFKEAAQKRHQAERMELESKQMVERAQGMAAIQAKGGDVDEAVKQLDSRCTAELDALEVAQFRGLTLGQKELAPTQYEMLQNQMATKSAARDLVEAKEAMSAR